MRQLVFDPRRPVVSQVCSANGPLPKAVRRFGLLPDLNAIQPGDLLLVRDLAPGCITRMIITAQRNGGYSLTDSRWHHAALYLGDGFICEATIFGVKRYPLFKYVTGHHLLRFRRSPIVSLEDGYRMALKASTRLNEAYGFTTLAKLCFYAAGGFWRARRMSKNDALVCSMLYGDAFSWVTGRTLENRESRELTPAFLSQTASLIDVPITWHRLAPRPGVLSGGGSATGSHRRNDEFAGS